MQKNLFSRYCLFALGLLLNAFGAALIIKAAMGTSPISAVPYSLSLILPVLSLGGWTALYGWVLIGLQWLLLKKQANKLHMLISGGTSLFFGTFIDLAMLCLAFWQPVGYPAQLLTLVTGCLITAIGAYLELVADVAMIPADAFLYAVTKVTDREYGTIRLWSDITMSAIAALLCLLFLHRLVGVREGTLLCALLVGNMVKLIRRHLNKTTAAPLA